MNTEFGSLLGLALVIVAIAWGCRSCGEAGWFDTSKDSAEAYHRKLYEHCVENHTPAECKELRP